MSTHTNEYDIEVFLCGFLAFMAKPNRVRAPPRDFLEFNQLNLKEDIMNKKNLHTDLFEDREIQNRFTAYVQEAMKNTRSTYYTKK